MLTFFKEIFTWWNRQTLGTRIFTIFFGKFVGKDIFGNRYYENKSGRRWVIYKNEVEATKIPNDWYCWIHHTNNKLSDPNNIKKFDWQKPHLPNQTGTEDSYHPKKMKKDEINKKYKSWKN